MAEIEPASDEMIENVEEGAHALIDAASTEARMPMMVVLAILARLRKAETDNANMTKLLSGYHRICREAGIAPASSEIYAAAERVTQGGENG